MVTRRVRLIYGIVLLLCVAIAAALLLTPRRASAPTPATLPAQPSGSSGLPGLEESIIMDGLDRPWDIAFLPDQTMLVSERGYGISIVDSSKKSLLYKPDDLRAVGEGGMLGIAVDPDFGQNRYIYACFVSKGLSAPDVRVVRLAVSADVKSISNRTDIVTGMPAADSGRHSGCRLRFDSKKVLWVATGDAARGSVPQDPKSLGGKVLRIDRDGKPAPGNLGGAFDARIYSYGHRNLQGLAFWPGNSKEVIGFSVEHGSDKDDEINALLPGNFGWDPSSGVYDESVPMTDTIKFKDAVPAVWRSGSPTIAPSGATFITGNEWGRLNGALAVAVLKDKHVRFFTFGNDKKPKGTYKLLESYGRVRSVVQGPDGALYLSTDNGQSQDSIVKVVPR